VVRDTGDSPTVGYLIGSPRPQFVLTVVIQQQLNLPGRRNRLLRPARTRSRSPPGWPAANASRSCADSRRAARCLGQDYGAQLRRFFYSRPKAVATILSALGALRAWSPRRHRTYAVTRLCRFAAINQRKKRREIGIPHGTRARQSRSGRPWSVAREFGGGWSAWGTGAGADPVVCLAIPDPGVPPAINRARNLVVTGPEPPTRPRCSL